MTLNITALSIVKAIGIDYPPWQLVFLRAFFGLILVLPFIWYKRHTVFVVATPMLHLLRVMLATIALTSSYYAITRLPLVLFTTLNFTRPLILMCLCMLFLNEKIGNRGWIAATAGMIGVWVALSPPTFESSPALLALVVTVFAGSGAVMLTRKLGNASELQLLLFYAAGLTIFTLLPAAVTWQPLAVGHLLLLAGVAALTQLAQYCFIRSHQQGDIDILAPLGYVSLVVSVVIGLVVFAEVPAFRTMLGAGIIVLATALLRQQVDDNRSISSGQGS